MKIMTARFLIVALAARDPRSRLVRYVWPGFPAHGAKPVVLAPFTAQVTVEPPEKRRLANRRTSSRSGWNPRWSTEWGPG